MRRFIITFALAAGVASALDLTNGNAVTLTDRTGSTQTSRPFTIHRWFKQGEITGYPQPYNGNTAITPWQSDRVNRWPDGSVQSALISFKATVSASSTLTVNFRNNANPCSTQTSVSACRADGLSTSAALNFDAGAGAGNWGAKMKFTAEPQGTSSVQTVNARTMLTDTKAWAFLSGPVVTQYIAGLQNSDGTYETARSYAVGFSSKVVARMTANMDSTSTSVTLQNASPWASQTRPFKVWTNSLGPSERMSVCYVNSGTNTLYFGTTNGSDATCATTAGRGVDGTSAAAHSVAYGDKIWLAEESTYLTVDILFDPINQAAKTMTVTVNDASGITVPAVIRVGDEFIRVCNKSGNVLTVGTGSSGCSQDVNGRKWYGSNPDTGDGGLSWPIGAPVRYTAPDIWLDAASSTYKSIQPAFVLTFYAGWPGVGIEYVYSDQWFDRLQDQTFTFEPLKGPSDTSVAVKTGVRLVPGARHHYPDGAADASWKNDRKIWDGTAPGEIRYDFNLPYMRYSGVILYDSTVAANATMIANELSSNNPVSAASTPSPALDNGSHGMLASQASTTSAAYSAAAAIQFEGPVYRGLPDPGGRGDISLSPRWPVSSLFMMASNLTNAHRWMENMMASAYIGGYIPIHITESDTSKKYCDKGTSSTQTTAACTGADATLSAFGYPLSKHARPELNWVSRGSNLYAELPQWVGLYTRGGWAISQSDLMAHWPSLYWIPWVITGDWYFYWGQQHNAHYGAMISGYPPTCSSGMSAGNRQSCAKGDWGVGGISDGPRNWSWHMREVFRGHAVAYDGTPEKKLLRRTADINIAVAEGQFNITNGSFYVPCQSPIVYDYSFWCFGFAYRGNGDTSMGITAPLEYVTSTGQTAVADFMLAYRASALAEAYSTGLAAQGALKGTVRRVVNQAMNRSQWPIPFSLACYYQRAGPVFSGTVNIGDTVSYASWAAAYADRDAGCSAPTNFQGNDCDLEGGYARLSSATLALSEFFVDPAIPSVTGTAAYDWIRGNMKCNEAEAQNAQWAFSQQSQHEIRNFRLSAVGTTTATILFERPRAAASCTYLLGTSAPADSSTASDTAYTAPGAWNKDLSLSLTGLTTATAYNLRVTCGQGRGTFTFTTN